MLTLTKKTKGQLSGQFIGTGNMFIKTGDKELTTVEFWMGKTGNFYTLNCGKNQRLEDYLLTLGKELKDIDE